MIASNNTVKIRYQPQIKRFITLSISTELFKDHYKDFKCLFFFFFYKEKQVMHPFPATCVAHCYGDKMTEQIELRFYSKTILINSYYISFTWESTRSHIL